MTNKIRILPDSVCNKIAAGEVVERPASVVKELVENSLDADAARIRVTVEGGGLRLISVSDDGCGMSADDALLCIEPHATSKIYEAEDLSRISSLGFRGEALPSIASVSRFRLRTRAADTGEGVELRVEGGRIVSCLPAGCAKGSEVTVKELFYNVPARRKFLSGPETEEKRICEAVYDAALANPHVGFEYFRNGREIFRSPPDQRLEARIESFFGRSFLDGLVPVEFEEKGIEIKGFAAKHGFTRSSRFEQRLFVNGRPAGASVLYSSIKEAYSSIITAGRFPPVILFIMIDPGQVDVNVHPAKKEVRFSDPSLVRAVLGKAVKSALGISSSPTVHVNTGMSFRQILERSTVDYALQAEPKKSASLYPLLSDFQSQDRISSPAAQYRVGPEDHGASLPRISFVASLGDSFLAGVGPEGLFVIDQHAAHERILFERLSAASESSSPPSQRLLIPETVEVSGAEASFAEENAGAFSSLGFEIERFGGNSIIVRAVPPMFSGAGLSTFIKDVIDDLSVEGGVKPALEDIAKSACRKAVKSRDRLSGEEAQRLIDDLLSCRMPFSCPHGRPTMISITLAELQKRFGRSVSP